MPPNKRSLANLKVNNPAEPGNRRAVKHGGHAQPEPRRQKALERQLAEMVPVKDDDGKPNPADQIVIRLLAVVLVQLESVSRYVARNGPLTRTGKIAPATTLQERLISRAQNLCAELGMSPKSRVALGLQIKQTEHLDLAQLLSDPKPKQIDEPIQDAEVIE